MNEQQEREARAAYWCGRERTQFSVMAEAVYLSATERLLGASKDGDAVIIGWIVGDDPLCAAMYNLGQRDEAFDAARRWNCSITALVAHPHGPELSIPVRAADRIEEQS